MKFAATLLNDEFQPTTQLIVIDGRICYAASVTPDMNPRETADALANEIAAAARAVAAERLAATTKDSTPLVAFKDRIIEDSAAAATGFLMQLGTAVAVAAIIIGGLLIWSWVAAQP